MPITAVLEAMLTMQPPDSSRWGRAAWIRKNGPFTFTPNMASQPSSVTSPTCSCQEMPAMLPSTSIRPKAAAHPSAARRQSATDDTSAVWVRMVPPPARTCSATASSPASSTSTPNTEAPSPARRIEAARPIPDAAPVKRAALPSNRAMGQP